MEQEDDAGDRELEGPGRPEFKVLKHKIGRRPPLPTKAEIDELHPLHLHYIFWRAHCVAGKARSRQHLQAKEEQERLGVTLNADYAFMSGEHNEGERGMRPTLVLYDDDKDRLWVLAVDGTGAMDAMVKYGVGTIEQSDISGKAIIQIRSRTEHCKC